MRGEAIAVAEEEHKCERKMLVSDETYHCCSCSCFATSSLLHRFACMCVIFSRSKAWSCTRRRPSLLCFSCILSLPHCSTDLFIAHKLVSFSDSSLYPSICACALCSVQKLCLLAFALPAAASSLAYTCLFFLLSLGGGGGGSMEERVKGGGEPLEVEQQERAARLAKRRFGAVGPPPSS